MAIRTEVREEFAEGFDSGFEWLDRRRRLSNWRWFQTIRALDAVLELINERVKSDPRDALRQGDRVLRLVLPLASTTMYIWDGVPRSGHSHGEMRTS